MSSRSRKAGETVTGRGFALLLAPLLAALALVPSRAADAQTHIELSPCPGHVSISFDLPAGYTVTEQSENIVGASGPVMTHPHLPAPKPAESGMVSGCEEHRGRTPKEAVYEVAAEIFALPVAGPKSFTVVTEGPLTVGQLEGYSVLVRSYFGAIPDPDTYGTSLFVVFPVAREDYLENYLWLWIGGNMERLDGEDVLLENAEPVSQENQRGYDAIVSSLTVSVTPPVTPALEATPTPPATPTPGHMTPTPGPVTPTAAAEPAPAVPAGERVKLGPIEEGGKQYTFSFSLPEGYTIAELTPTELTAQGPLTNTDEPLPDELRALAIATSGQGTVDGAARQWAEAGCGEARRSQIVVEGSVSLAESDGYSVLWACMQETATGPVPFELQAVLLIASERDRFVGLEARHGISPIAWSHPTPDEWAAEWVLEIGGRPADEVHRANLDAVLASLSVSTEDLGVTRSDFARSVPGPDEISIDPDVIGSNIVLTLIVLLAFLFTSTLFNQTLEENRQEIDGRVGRLFAPFQRLTSFVGQQYGVVAERRPWVQRVVGPAVILALTGLVYGFLSPDFGFNTKGVVLFASMVVGVGAMTYLYKGGQVLFTTRRLRLRAGVKLYAAALAIAAACVLLSRLVDFKPGFLFGFVASYTLLAPAALDRRQRGQTVLFPAVALAALSVVAWLLVIPLRDVAQGSESWWVALPEGAAVTAFVVGLEGLFFNMIPLTFMDGAKIAGWNRLLWFVMFATAGFLFWHVLLNQEGEYMEPLRETRVITALSLLAACSIITLATWTYFRVRVSPTA